MFGDKVVPKVFRCGTGRVVRKIGANTGAFSLTHTCIEVKRTVVMAAEYPAGSVVRFIPWRGAASRLFLSTPFGLKSKINEKR